MSAPYHRGACPCTTGGRVRSVSVRCDFSQVTSVIREQGAVGRPGDGRGTDSPARVSPSLCLYRDIYCPVTTAGYGSVRVGSVRVGTTGAFPVVQKHPAATVCVCYYPPVTRKWPAPFQGLIPPTEESVWVTAQSGSRPLFGSGNATRATPERTEPTRTHFLSSTSCHPLPVQEKWVLVV